MRKLLVSLCLAIISLSAAAQKPPVKFGDVSKEELSMTTYDKDTSAAAVILADYGESAIVYRQSTGFSLDFERITRIKVLKKDGLRWGDFSIPLFRMGADDEKIASLKAVTYNLENGKIVESKVKNEAIFREEYDASWEIVKLTCSNVRVGSVIEITYHINSPFFSNFQDWSFQSTIPTVVSEYRAQIPEYFHYDRYMQGYIPLDVNDQTMQSNSIRLTSMERRGGGFSSASQSSATSRQIDYMDVKNRWIAYDVPAFREEPHMTTAKDFITKINFEIASIKWPNERVIKYMGSWEDINKTLHESERFGGEIKANGFLRKIVDEVTAGLSSPEEKIAAISGYVKQNVVWDGAQRMYPVLPLRKVLENKKGSSAEINFLLASMLEKAGITVLPVALSTRDHGMLRVATPISSQFNYVICLARANEKFYLLDATEKLLPLGMLPERCLNGQGFAISEEGFQWIPLESKFKTRKLISCDFVLDPGGALDGKLKLDFNGYAALRHRKKYLANGESEYLKDFVGTHAWELRSSTIENAKEIQDNFTQEHELVVNENMTVAGETIYLNPFIAQAYKENPFKAEVRQYPVDFGSPTEETFLFRLTVPENYTVDELPESKIIAMPENGARYIYNVSQNGNKISITSMFHINKSLFTQLEYPYLREFYNQIVAKQAEQIVLKRK